MGVDLKILQEEVALWALENFGRDVPQHQPLLGVGEEVGELMHAQLKYEQGIRGYDVQKFSADGVDAIGDIMIYLADYCNRAGFSLDECVRTTWEKVRRRDWKKDPEGGGEEFPSCHYCGETKGEHRKHCATFHGALPVTVWGERKAEDPL